MYSGQNNKNIEFYFSEPRLLMTIGGRVMVRVASYVSYIVFLVAGFTLVFSDITRLKLLGVLILLFFADLVFHYGEGDKPFSEMPEEGRVNLSGRLSPSAYSVIEKSFDRSVLSKSNFFMETAKELMMRKEIKEGLMRLDLKPEEVEHKINSLMAPEEGRPRPDKKAILAMAETLVVSAGARSIMNNRQFVETADLFSGLFFVGDEKITRVFNTFSVEAADLELAMLISSLKRKMGFSLPSSIAGFTFETQRGIRHRVVNRAWTSRPTPTLDRYSSDLTDLAREREGGFIIGHNNEYQRLVDTLSRPINPNAMLVGEEGIGKGTLVMHLARQIVNDEVPPQLFDKRLVSLEIMSMVAGASAEEMQARVKRIAEEIFMAGNVILYIPDFHNLVKTSGSFYLSVADTLMPVIKENAFPVVAATYPKEFKESVEPRNDITGIFEIINVNEVSEEDAQRILVYQSLILERKYRMTISFAAMKAAVELGKKYLSTKFLPSSAEELLKDSLIIAQREGKKYLTRDDVVKAAEEKVNIPIHEATGEEAETLLNMEEIIHKRLIDQEEAVKAVSTSLREYRSGLTRKGGPIASFLFVGPTGVGKTELAKILAKIQFGDESAMTRFDMTEYQDKESFFRFIGSPDGKISGSLTEAILKKPYSLILLDEFEKAFPDILNLFLQVFDDGRLTDNLGRTVGFQNTIIIATSNAHSDIINNSLSQGESMQDIAEYLKSRLTDVFKPELINRFSRVVVFKDLSPDDVRAITKINLADFADALSEQGIKLVFDETAANQIAKIGYQPEFGARPLRRAIEESLRAPMAEKLLKKEIKRGDEVNVSFDGGNFAFKTKEQ